MSLYRIIAPESRAVSLGKFCSTEGARPSIWSYVPDMPKRKQDERYDRIVAPGDCEFSRDAGSRLVTSGLESCIAIVMHAPAVCFAALLRFSFPTSSANPRLAQKRPGLFADTAIPAFFAQIRSHGIQNTHMVIQAVGGAHTGEHRRSLPSGKSNYLMMRKMLWREGVLLDGEDVGGNRIRSLWLETGTGRIIVRSEAPASRPVPIDSTGADLWRSAC